MGGVDWVRGHIRVAMPTDDQVGGFASIDQFLGQGLIAIDRDAVAIAAIIEAKVAEDDDHVRLGFQFIVKVQD